MAALTNVYVDPSINANSGAGTSEQPYGDLQYALNTATHDATNGTQINIKAGTAETLSAVLSFATYGTSFAEEAPLVIKGYTTTANDGGVGIIDGNGGAVINASSPVQFILWDLHIRNGGSSDLVTLASNAIVRACKIDNTSGKGITSAGTYITVMGCEVTDCGVGIHLTNTVGVIHGNYLKFGTNRNFTEAIQTGNDSIFVVRNIISCGTSGGGIYFQGAKNRIFNNSVFAAGSTGSGIHVQYGASCSGALLFNNVVEGFSGAGGTGFYLGGTAYAPFIWRNNAAYNNTTNYDNLGDADVVDGYDNEVLSASPFAKSGSDTFANRYVYFAPVDTGNIHGGALQ